MHKTITLTLAEDYVTLTRGSARQRVTTDMLRAARDPDAILSQMLDRVTFEDALNRLEQAVFAHDHTAVIEILGCKATVYQHDKPTHTFDLMDPNVDYAEALSHHGTKPVIDWERVPDEYYFLTRDESGDCYLHPLPPKADMARGQWRHDLHKRVLAKPIAGTELHPGTCHWTDSLIWRD